MDDSRHLGPVRPGTSPKNICLSNEGRAIIQTWADAHQTSFSAAIETLARLSTGESPDTAMVPLLVSIIRTMIHREMRRYTRLAAVAAIHADMATSVTRTVLRLTIQDRAKAHPRSKDLADAIFDMHDDDPAEEIYQQICSSARRDAARRLRRPLQELLAADAGEDEE